MSSIAGNEDLMSEGLTQAPDETSKHHGPRVRFDFPDAPGTRNSKSTRRWATLYDSVAGRVNSNGFNPLNHYASKYRDTQSSGARDLHPEEVLYRTRPKALKKIQESDSYFAHEKLPADSPLPTSELLTAIHAYASDFYTQKLPKTGKYNFSSMDESALLAVGILMEELANEQLGETGDLALTEQPWGFDDEDISIGAPSSSRPQQKKRARAATIESPASLPHDKQGSRGKAKRNKLTKAEYEALQNEKEAQRQESPKKKQKHR